MNSLLRSQSVTRITSSNIVKFRARFMGSKTDSSSPNYKVGDVIHGFKVKDIDYIKELNLLPCRLEHESTGAQYLHIHKDGDKNNLFTVLLKTIPRDSTGLPHVLEHLALMGSKNYPIRDPFFSMMGRSLSTYMNAHTHSDYTAYPFSTQNEKDFRNLLSVYLDAVFFPNLLEQDFRQEAWRLEHEDSNDKNSPIVIKGIVYNEQLGTFSSAPTYYYRVTRQELYPDSNYRNDSGGKPYEIPNMTHKSVCDFYKLHYHPTNSKFFTYGDFPLEQHLKQINEHVLSKSSRHPDVTEKSKVELQPLWTEPRSISLSCRLDPLSPNPEKQSVTSISYLLPVKVTDLKEMFIIRILSSLLIDGPNAPFYKNLIESGLGSDYSPNTGLADNFLQPSFSVGLQGIHPDDFQKVHSIIDKTFNESKISGFPQERLDAVLHNIEIDLKHVSSEFGLNLLYNLSCLYNHDGDVIESLRFNKYIKDLKETLARDPNTWGALIDKYFINNQHKLISNMHPDPAYEDKRKQKEREITTKLISNLKEDEKEAIFQKGLELKKAQSAKQDHSVLPTLNPKTDISRDLPQSSALKFDQHRGVSIQLCEQPTNEVVYFNGLISFDDGLIENGLIDYLPLFCEVSTKLGAGIYDRHQLAQRMQLVTGGLSLSILMSPDLGEFGKFQKQIMISSHCLKRNVRNMLELWENIFKQIRFKDNPEYLHQLIKISAAEQSDRIVYKGHTYAVRRASSNLSDITGLEERLCGLHYVATLKDIASKEPVESIIDKLSAIAHVVLNPYNMKCAFNAETDDIKNCVDETKKFIETIQKYHDDSQDHINIPASNQVNEAQTKVEDLKFELPNNYVAKSLICVPKLHPDFAKLAVLTRLITSEYLHKEVREKGGAYGSGANMSNSGILSFYSYRDPETDKTFDIYNGTAKWIETSDKITEELTQQSKLNLFQTLDRPIAPGSRGLNYFMLKETDELRAEYRRRVLDVTVDDIRDVAKRYLNQETYGKFIL